MRFWSLKTKLVAVSSKVIYFALLTYSMIDWCILQKHISRPLLLLRSVPCHHIVSEMYLKPSRPQMHANSASRQNSRFVPQETASFLKSSSNFRCFPQWRSLQNLKKYRPALKINSFLRDYKTGLDSGFQAIDSRFQVPDFVSGTLIPDSNF